MRDFDQEPCTVDELLEYISKAIYELGKQDPREASRLASTECYRAWWSVKTQADAEKSVEEGGER